MPVPTYSKTGTKATSAAKLDKNVFGVEVKNHELLKQAYVAYMANGRENLATTKTRGLVSGGGRKPWRQKGTGRARFGSSRNPIWRGGGIVFGPSGQENYSKKLNLKSKRQALRTALTLAAQEDRIVVIEDLTVKNAKTADLSKLLAKINCNRNVLIVVANKSDELNRASKNLPGVNISTAGFVNVYDLLNADNVVFTADALDLTTNWLNKEAK